MQVFPVKHCGLVILLFGGIREPFDGSLFRKIQDCFHFLPWVAVASTPLNDTRPSSQIHTEYIRCQAAEHGLLALQNLNDRRFSASLFP